MKKLLSIVLAVAVLATMAFTMMASTVSAADAKTYSLLPVSADKFTKQDGGDGTITVTAEGKGYKFTSTTGWPCAYNFEEGVSDYKSSDVWVMTKKGSGSTLNYDFEVVSGSAKVVVYFCGQNPKDMAGLGSFVSINAIEMPDKKDPLTGDTAEDLPVGKYKKTLNVDDLGYGEGLLGDNGEMLITGVKVFAVGGEVIVNDISITDKSGIDNSHHKNVLETNDADPEPTSTTKVNSDATTTAAKTTAKAGTDNAKTGDTTNAILFVTVAAVAAAVVTVSVVSKKQKAR